MPSPISLLRGCCTFLLTVLLLVTGLRPVQAQPPEPLTLLGMQEEPFPLYRYQLANGLRIWLQPRPDSTSVTLLLAVDAGLKDETTANNGISHFTEHLLFAGSQRWDEAEIKAVITALGGRWNGYTTLESTAYYAQVEPQHFATALEWLVEITTRPLFSERTLAKEREVVFAEGWGQRSRVLDWLYAQGFGYDLMGALRRQLFPASPLGLSILGEQASLHAIDVAAVQAYHAAYYRPDNMVLVVVGNVSPAALAEGAETYLAALAAPATPRADAPPVTPALDGPTHVVVRGPFPTDQVRLAQGFTTGGRTAGDFWGREVLAEYLSQRLEREIRYVRGQVYSLWAEHVALADTGYLAIRTDGERRHRDAIVASIDAELDALVHGQVNPADFALARSARQGQQALALEDNLARAQYLAEWAMRLPPDAPAPDFRTALAAVTADDLAVLARTAAAPERRFLSEHLPIVTGAHLAWLLGAGVLVVVGGAAALTWRRLGKQGVNSIEIIR